MNLISNEILIHNTITKASEKLHKASDKLLCTFSRPIVYRVFAIRFNFDNTPALGVCLYMCKGTTEHRWGLSIF